MMARAKRPSTKPVMTDQRMCTTPISASYGGRSRSGLAALESRSTRIASILAWQSTHPLGKGFISPPSTDVPQRSTRLRRYLLRWVCGVARLRDDVVGEIDALVADADGRAGDELADLVLALRAERACDRRARVGGCGRPLGAFCLRLLHGTHRLAARRADDRPDRQREQLAGTGRVTEMTAPGKRGLLGGDLRRDDIVAELDALVADMNATAGDQLANLVLLLPAKRARDRRRPQRKQPPERPSDHPSACFTRRR